MGDVLSQKFNPKGEAALHEAARTGHMHTGAATAAALCVSFSLCVSVSLCVSLCLSLFLFLSLCFCLSLFLFLFLFLCLSLCTFAPLYSSLSLLLSHLLLRCCCYTACVTREPAALSGSPCWLHSLTLSVGCSLSMLAALSQCWLLSLTAGWGAGSVMNVDGN
jgi:hypothetical protein